MRKTIVASFVPRAYPVLLGFADSDVRSFYLPRDSTMTVVGADESAVLAAAAAAGVEVTHDAFGFAGGDAGAIRDEAAYRTERIAASSAFRSALDALSGDRDTVARALLHFVPAAIREAIGLIDTLDDLAQRTDIRGVIVTEDASPVARTLVRWARQRGIPSLMLTHGATPHMLYVAEPFADDHYIYGDYVVPTLLETGVHPDRVHVGTYYGHLEYDAVPADARERFRARFGIPSDSVVVVLALGFNGFFSSLEPEWPWFLALLQVFLRATRHLRDRGIAFAPVIKHRWNDPAVEATARAAARDAGIEEIIFFDGPMTEVLPATDILCGTESNTLVEALLFDVAIVDIVYPWHWLIGPCFGAGEGVVYADARDPEHVASVLAPLVAHSGERRRNVERLRELGRQLIRDRSRGLAGIADDLLAILERRRSTLPSDTTPTYAAPIDSIRAIPSSATRILDLTGAAETPSLIRAIYAGMSVDGELDTPHDVVLLGYALARSATPETMLAGARIALAPGGCVIVEFANARNLRAINDLLDDRPWPERRVGRDPSAPSTTLTDMLALLAHHGFRADDVRPHDDAALARIDPSGPGTLALGRLTIEGIPPAGLHELKASGFTIVARLTAAR